MLRLPKKFDRTRLGKASKYLDDAKGRTGAAAKKTTFKLGKRVAKGSQWLGKQSARRILSGARTAGRKVSLSKRMRKIDGHKIDDLSRSQESRLRTLLAHTGDDGVEAINEMDSDTVDDLLDLRPSCTGGPVSGSSYSCLDDETVDEAIESVVKATDDPDVSDAEVDRAVKYLSELDRADRNQALKLLAEADSDGIKLINRLDADTLSTLARNTDQIDSVRITDDVLTVKAKRNGMDVTVKYPDDGEHYVRTTGGVGDRDLSDLSATEKGDIVEEEIAPKLAEERGYNVRNPFDTGTEDTGFDVIAKDPKTGDWVIIEAKFKSKGGSISKKTWLDNPNKGRQMSNEWIDKTITEMRQKADTPEEKEFVRKLRRAYERGNIREELVTAQNAKPDGQTVLDNLNDLDITHVDIIKLGKVIN